VFAGVLRLFIIHTSAKAKLLFGCWHPNREKKSFAENFYVYRRALALHNEVEKKVVS
jgi:hypothetical protein